tara:strand:- start:2864 stop:3886 length:1023 start_codon:yes stop_codon:yes gene_type:complete
MNNHSSHEFYMSRCIEIAKKGKGITYPNPYVGCIIVHNDVIISEAFSSKHGENHAEVNAINNVKNKSLLKNSILYVTLEPCSHFGKTPPCCNTISSFQIPKVIVGTLDNSSKVNGKGIDFLKKNKVNVIVGVLENECKELHKNFLHFNKNKRPYIILKWAQSKDGFISPKNKLKSKPFWISNTKSRQIVHKWRSEEHGILVGYNTIIKDNPNLNVRDYKGENPTRIVIDKENGLNKNYKVFNNEANTLVISKKEIDFSKKISNQICDFLYEKKIQSVIIEGGKKTLDNFINNGNWDEARIFKSTILIKEGIKAPEINGEVVFKENIGSDTITFMKPSQSI